MRVFDPSLTVRRGRDDLSLAERPGSAAAIARVGDAHPCAPNNHQNRISQCEPDPFSHGPGPSTGRKL